MGIISLKNIKKLIFVMAIGCVFFAVWTKCIYVRLRFKKLNIKLDITLK